MAAGTAMGKIGATPNSDAERRALQSFVQLQAAEADCRSVGLAFGHAVVALREEIKTKRGRDFMERLKQLGISQEKARYWMAKAERKKTNRHKDADEKKPFTWEDAADQLNKLVRKASVLGFRSPKNEAAFAENMMAQAKGLMDEAKKRRGHAQGVLQRKQPRSIGRIAVAHGELAHSAGRHR
jgi:hypothetical protein